LATTSGLSYTLKLIERW